MVQETGSPESPTASTVRVPLALLAQEKLGTEATFAYMLNASKNHVLVTATKADAPKARYAAITFFVYDLEREQIVFEDTIPQGEVSWKNAHQLEIIQLPGIIQGNERGDRRGGYVYDVRYRQKMGRK